jgi:hypothetical protein
VGAAVGGGALKVQAASQAPSAPNTQSCNLGNATAINLVELSRRQSARRFHWLM